MYAGSSFGRRSSVGTGNHVRLQCVPVCQPADDAPCYRLKKVEEQDSYNFNFPISSPFTKKERQDTHSHLIAFV
jgi:hypothetical protein